MKGWFRFAVCLTALGMAFSLVHGGQAQEPQIIVAEDEGGAGTELSAGVVLTEGEGVGEGANLPEYWLGVMGERTSDVLKAQLKIDGGLIVGSVVDGSPAAKGGLQTNDVLLQFAGKTVNTLEDLVEALRGVNGAETEMVVIRGGEKMTLKVSPEKRPATDPQSLPPGTSDDALRHYGLREMIINRDGHPQKVRVYAVRPGFVVGQTSNFPKNTSISIVKENDGPAKIEVKQGDKLWSVTEDNLGDLPEELRAVVQHSLSGEGHIARIEKLGDPQPVPPVRVRVEALRRGGPVVRSLDVRRVEGGPNLAEKLDQLMEKIEKIEKELQSLKEKSNQ